MQIQIQVLVRGKSKCPSPAKGQFVKKLIWLHTKTLRQNGMTSEVQNPSWKAFEVHVQSLEGDFKR